MAQSLERLGGTWGGQGLGGMSGDAEAEMTWHVGKIIEEAMLNSVKMGMSMTKWKWKGKEKLSKALLHWAEQGGGH